MKKEVKNYSLKGFENSIVSIVIVTENDEDMIKDRLESINKTLNILGLKYEILIVDNNSNDKTVETVKNMSEVMRFARILVLSKEYAKEIAITAGLDNCVGDYAIVFDIYTDPTEMIPYFLVKKLIDKNDIVIGQMANPINSLGIISKIFLKLTEKLSSHGFHYRQGSLMGLNRKAINLITRSRRKSRNFGYLHSIIGLVKDEVVYQPIKKYAYKLKRESLTDVIISVLDISMSNSFKPIRILSVSGMIFSLLYLVYVAIVIVLVLFFGMRGILPQGWVTLSTVLGTMFLLLFSLLTVMSEYIIRILAETRNEPFYFVSEEINKSSILPKKGVLNII